MSNRREKQVESISVTIWVLLAVFFAFAGWRGCRARAQEISSGTSSEVELRGHTTSVGGSTPSFRTAVQTPRTVVAPPEASPEAIAANTGGAAAVHLDPTEETVRKLLVAFWAEADADAPLDHAAIGHVMLRRAIAQDVSLDEMITRYVSMFKAAVDGKPRTKWVRQLSTSCDSPPPLASQPTLVAHGLPECRGASSGLAERRPGRPLPRQGGALGRQHGQSPCAARRLAARRLRQHGERVLAERQMSALFTTILMDPPWPESGGGKIKRGADRHYPLVKVHDMLAVISLADQWKPAPDSHLYMWVTNNYLPDGLRLMGDLGFRYVTNIAWIKDRSGLGQYFRGQHELLLFGVRGNGIGIRTERRDLTTVLDESGFIEAPRGKHSAKPGTFHELIEARSPGPYLEMFARSGREGWAAWGNQAPEENVP